MTLGEQLEKVKWKHSDECLGSSTELGGRSGICTSDCAPDYDAIAAKALAHFRAVLTREAILRAVCQIQDGDPAADPDHPEKIHGRQADAILVLLDAVAKDCKG